MAPRKPKDENNDKLRDVSQDIKDAFKEVDKMNEDGSFLSEGSLSQVNTWIDTGSMALNAIFSGSLYKGIPCGRLTGFSGPPTCGKSLMIMKIIANAQKRGMYGVVWDSESACDSYTAERLGCDLSKLKVYPVETLSEMRNQCVKFLNSIIEKGLQEKFIIGLDSLGNLLSTKEKADAESGKDSTDMGARAKEAKACLRGLTYKCAKAKIPFVFSNHIYGNPAQLHPSSIQQAAGGKGPEYLASLLVQLGISKEKIEDNIEEQTVAIAHKYNGISINAITTKNRFIPMYLTTSLYLNFKTGLEKFSGLKEMAEAYSIIKKDGHSYFLKDGTKLGLAEDWKNDEKAWELILPTLEKTIEHEFSYSNKKYEELKTESDKIEKEVEST